MNELKISIKHQYIEYFSFFKAVRIFFISANIITVDEVRKLNEAGKIKKNYEDPIQKDTIPVPDAGFAVMRFRADNPGFWIMHCHIDFHKLKASPLWIIHIP